MAGVNLKDIANKQEQVKGSAEKKKKESFLNRDIQISRKRLSSKQKEAFYREFATLLKAGLDVKATLDLLASEQTNRLAIQTIEKLNREVIKGALLSEAMQQDKSFTPYEYHSIAIGEEIGALPLVLEELAKYFEQKIKQQRQIVGALSYPVLILSTSLGAVSFMLMFIVPMFADIFARFGGELPYLTQLIIEAGNLVNHYGWIGLLLLAALMLFCLMNSKKEWYQKTISILIGYLPLFGKIIVSAHLARFCSAMALLSSAKVPLIRSLELLSEMINFYPIRVSIHTLKIDIISGESLHGSMRKFSVFDARMVALVKVGEEVNKLDVFFKKLAEQYSEEVQHKTSLLNTFIEPVMILILGAIVGFILIAMYLPMFQISTSIGG